MGFASDDSRANESLGSSRWRRFTSENTEARMAEKLLDVQHLRTHFYTRAGVVKAVEDVSFYIEEGETLGLVGESGCGKSVTSLSLLRLLESPPGKIVGGQ